MEPKTSGKPPLEESRFTESFLLANRLSSHDLKDWLLSPGMLFDADVEWWGNRAQRKRLHEGLDLCLFRDGSDITHRFNKKTRIPAMFDGEIVHLMDDFLGRSVVMAHAFTDADGRRFCTMYGHTVIADNLRIGKTVCQGEIVATVAEPAKSKRDILPHLHISIGWVSPSLPLDRLDWNIIGTRGAVTLIDPLDVLDGPYYIQET
jgi:hypothetical protein